LACSILACELETKFQKMCRSPSIGAPPMRATRASLTARRVAAAPGVNTSMRPGSARSLPHSTVPVTM